MPSPIFGISLIRAQDMSTIALYIRRTPHPKATRDHAFSVPADAVHVEQTILSYSDWFPRSPAPTWVLLRTPSSKGGQMLLMRRYKQGQRERMPFDDTFELFLCHMRLFVTQAETSATKGM